MQIRDGFLHTILMLMQHLYMRLDIFGRLNCYTEVKRCLGGHRGTCLNKYLILKI